MKKTLIAIIGALLLALPGFATSSKYVLKVFQNPDDAYRPYVRWWWNGDKVEANEIRRELNLLKEAGIAGVEINPVAYPGKENEDDLGIKSITWLSDEWLDMLGVAFDEAKKLGMTCDLIVGSGWPFGAESLPREERASVILTYCDTTAKAGTIYDQSLFHVFKELDPKATTPHPSRTPELLKVLLVPDPINDLSEARDISDQVKDGVINMVVPEGKWQVYYMVKYNSFASVINGAPGAAGPILDHMNEAAVRKYLKNMSDKLEARFGPMSQYLRAYFVDSMELEGANWTGDFAQEFKRRRGYDILPWLPFTMFKLRRLGEVENFNYGSKKGAKFQDQVNRARYDFELTKAELLEERFFKVYRAWCNEQGVKARAQAYGCGFFPLETSMTVDIPEGESWTTNWLRHVVGEEMGDQDYRRGRAYTMIDKYVSSAAHLQGKRLVSAEEMTNTYNVFSTSLEYLKVGSDMSCISGITHSVWHGFNYSPKEAPFPGWVRYGSYYNEKNTWWPYFKLLNDYRARVGALVRNADMYTDIAILPANADLWSTMGVQTEPFPVKLNVPYTSLVWEAIHKNGGGADYVSERILEGATVKNGKLCYGPKEYSVLFTVEVRGTTVEAMEKIREFVLGGGRVFCIETYPEKSVGMADADARDARVAQIVKELEQTGRFVLLPKPEDNRFLEWYADVMQQYNLPHTLTISQPDRFLLQNRYVMDDGSNFFFFVNASRLEGKGTDITFPASITRGRKAWLYDPATGKRYSLKVPADGKIHFDFGPSESFVFMFNKMGGKAPEWKAPKVSTGGLEVRNWKVSFENPEVPDVPSTVLDTLADLKDIPAYQNFMGVATYTAEVELPAGNLPRYLNLGKVGYIAEVTINGKPAGLHWYGDVVLEIGGLLKPGANTIEVKVTTLMSNYLQTLPDNLMVQRFILRRKTPLMPAGLIGPVVLY